MHVPITASDRSDAVVPTSMTYRWAIVGMLWLICFFNYADRQAISAVLPKLEAEFGFDKEQLGLIGAIFAYTYGMLAPFAGGTSDHFRRKTIILWGLYVWSAITGFTALCTKYAHFLWVRATEGIGETFYFPASMSLISDYHDKTTRSRAMGLHQTSVYAGTIGGAYFAGWMADVYNWRYPFVILGVAGIILGMFLAYFIKEPPKDMAEKLRAEAEAKPILPQAKGSYLEFLGQLARNPTFLTLALAFVGANFVAVVVLIWMPTFLHEKFDLSLGSAAFNGTFYIHTCSVLGAAVGGVLGDRLRRRHSGGRIMVEVLGALIGAPFIYWCGTAGTLNTAIVAMILFGFFKGVYDANIWAALFDVIPAPRRASAVGLMNMCGWALGGFPGPWIVGRMVKGGMAMSEAIAWMSVIYLGMAFVLTFAAFAFAPRDVARAASVKADP